MEFSETHSGAVEMVRRAIPDVWKSQKFRIGDVTEELNRHVVAHGAEVGWDSEANATRAVLLVAAAARVAEPLLGPRPANGAAGGGDDGAG